MNKIFKKSKIKNYVKLKQTIIQIKECVTMVEINLNFDSRSNKIVLFQKKKVIKSYVINRGVICELNNKYG